MDQQPDHSAGRTRQAHILRYAMLAIACSVLLPASAWAMDELTDGQMEQTTGQDGLTVLLVPPQVGGLPGVTLQNITYDSNTSFTGTAGKGYLRSSVNGVVLQGATLGSAPGSSTPIGITIDATGGGVSTATTGANPAVYATLSMPTVNNISLQFNTATNGNNANLLDASSAIAGTYVPIASIGNTPGTFANQQMNIRLASPIVLDFAFGKANVTGHTSLLTFTALNIQQIDFNGSALNLESPNGGTGASRLSMTPTITGLNLTGATLGVVTTAGMQTVFPTATAGGVLLQNFTGLATANMSVALNNVTAGASGTAGSGNVGSTMLNAPLGSFGVTGMNITGLKVGISGM